MSWTHSPPTPFGDPCERVPLPDAPLALVLAQVRFTPIVSIANADYIASFQESIRQNYPILTRELQQQIQLGPQGLQTTPPPTPGVIWRFVDQDQNWRLSLAQDFIAVETSNYTHRDDFHKRLAQALTALEDHLRPGLTTRIGVRYMDRIAGDMTTRLEDYVRPELLSLEATDLGSARLDSGVTEAHFAVDDVALKARWGSLPIGVVHDPIVQPLADQRTWVLDLDASTTDAGPFDASAIAESAKKFGEVIYRFFRWAVSDEFLREFGGDV